MAYRETEKMRRRKADARRRILTAAHQCVAEGGFQRAQVSTVAQEAGVATGTVYRHFASKAELFAEIFRQATEQEVSKVANSLTGTGPAAQRLETALTKFAQRALRGRQMAWSLIAEPVDPEVERERLRYRDAYAGHFRQAIEDGIEDGSLPHQSASIAATCLVGAMGESLVGPLAPGKSTGENGFDTANNQQLIEPIIRFCMQALTGRGRQDS